MCKYLQTGVRNLLTYVKINVTLNQMEQVAVNKSIPFCKLNVIKNTTIVYVEREAE